MAKTTPPHIPVALVGGGLTTQIFAIALVHCGFEFVWFSGAPAPQPAGPDTRTTTIHHAGKIMLDTLDIWPALAKEAYPITKIAVAGQYVEASRKRMANWPLCWTQDEPPMAYVVANQALEAACAQMIKKTLSDSQRQAIFIESFEPGQPTILQDNKKNSWHCDLLIACDGANSTLRKAAGLNAIDQGRNESAIVTTVQTTKPIETTAYQRFLRTGPLALMPINAHKASVVWSLPHDQACEIQDLDNAGFDAAINAAFGPELGWLKQDEACLIWPLQPAYCPKISKPGFALAGDAAHALHPLAGMGFNLALADCAVLLDCLQSAARSGLTVDHASISRAYQARRQPEILTLTAATQGLNRLLTGSANPLYQFACIGMSVLGQIPARRLLSKLAMGGQFSPAPLFEGRLHQS